ncbi:MAG: hypothetical protein ACPG6V_11735 [Flavobacteriales bacterium]
MRTSFLLFLTLSAFLFSCKDEEKQEIREFDIDSKEFLFQNPGSYWIYETFDGQEDTITLLESEISLVDGFENERLSRQRIDKYYSTFDDDFFYRKSYDTTIYVFHPDLGKYADKKVFKFKNKFHTYISDIKPNQDYRGSDFYINQEIVDFPIGTDKYYVKEIFGGNTYEYKELDSAWVLSSSKSRSVYALGIGMILNDDLDSTLDRTMKSFFIAP